MAQRVAEQPADEPLTIEKWELELDAGITVEADLSGSLARDLSYRFEVIGPDGEELDHWTLVYEAPGTD